MMAISDITLKLRFKRRWFYWPAFCMVYALVAAGMDHKRAIKFMINKCSILEIR